MIVKLGTFTRPIHRHHAPLSIPPSTEHLHPPTHTTTTTITTTDIASWCWALMCLIFGIHALVGAKSTALAEFCLGRWTFMGFGWLILLADCALFLLVHRVGWSSLCTPVLYICVFASTN